MSLYFALCTKVLLHWIWFHAVLNFKQRLSKHILFFFGCFGTSKCIRANLFPYVEQKHSLFREVFVVYDSMSEAAKQVQLNQTLTFGI